MNVTDSWLRLIDKKIAYFQGVADTIDDKNLGGDTQVHVPFLNEDLSMGYARSKETVREQRDDIARILSSISDLVSINVFSSHDVDQDLDAADKKRAKMALDVQELDQNLTNEYKQINEDLPDIQSLYEELINATRQGADVQPMHFNATAYHDNKIYQVQDEMRKETQNYLKVKEHQEQARIMTAEASLPPDVRMHLLNDRINRGMTQGLIDVGKDIVYGFIDMARDPLKTATNMVMSLQNWKQTSALIARAITESYDKDMVHGDAYTRSRWVTYAFATLATTVVGTKGVGQVSKAVKLEKLGGSARKISTLTKTDVVKQANKAAEKMNGWNNPFAPKMQFAGDVPYNTINSSGLRNKLSRIAESTGKSTFTDHISYVRNLNQRYRNLSRNKPGIVNNNFNVTNSLQTQTKLMYNQGSLGIIPKEIRDKLIDKQFNSFDEFRQEFWKTVAKSSYSTEFNNRNIARMLKGNAPIAPKAEHYGKNKSYILHHKQPIDKGGEVYNLDNLIITSPKMHQNILDPAYHFGKKGH